LLESEFFLSIRECCRSLYIPQSILPASTVTTSIQPHQPVPPSNTAYTQALYASTTSSEISSCSTEKKTTMEPPKSHLGRRRLHHNARDEKLVYITKEEFQELKSMAEKYDPKKKYIHLWDLLANKYFNTRMACLFQRRWFV